MFMIFLTLVHSKLHNITLVATKMHVTLHSFVVLTWMRDALEST